MLKKFNPYSVYLNKVPMRQPFLKNVTSILCFVFIIAYTIPSFAEGTKQFMPNDTDRLWIEFYRADDMMFGTYNATSKQRINIYLNAGEILHLGMQLATESSRHEPDYQYIGFRIMNSDSAVVYSESTIATVSENGYINSHAEAINGPNGVSVNGTAVTDGYDALTMTAATSGNYWIEFETWEESTLGGHFETDGNTQEIRKFAFNLFDATVTDASGNLITNPGEPNIAAGRLWSKGWAFTNTSTDLYPVKTDFYVFTADEFVNKVEFEMKPWAFNFVANSFGVTKDDDLNFIEQAQSQDGNVTQDTDISEYKIFLNDPDREVWPTTTLAPPEVKVWFEDELIYDYNYNRTPQLESVYTGTVALEKNDASCEDPSLALFKIETNIAGFAVVLFDLNGGGYSTDGDDRAINVELKEGLNYILWNCKDDNGDDVADGVFTASATFLGRGPAHFPLDDCETLGSLSSSSVRPFNKLDPTIYWDDREITTWGDDDGNMAETADNQLDIDGETPRFWTYNGDNRSQHNGNSNTLNTWYNAIDLGLTEINFSLNVESGKCVDGNAPYVGDIYLYSDKNVTYSFTETDFTDKFFDPTSDDLGSIRILSLPENGSLTYNGSAATIDLEVSNANLSLLEYDPDSDYYGKDYFEWEASDLGGTWSLNQDSVYLIINTDPTLSSFSDAEICTNTDLSDVAFTFGDDESDADDLTIEGYSHDPSVISSSDITFSGSGTDRYLSVTPQANVSGYAIIYIKVDDGLSEVIEQFAIYIGPTMTFTGDTTVCANSSLLLSAEETGATYSWEFDGNVCSDSSQLSVVTMAEDSSGVYTLTVTKDGCTASREINLSVSPIVSFTGDIDVCEGEAISLSADETVADSYIWKKETTSVGTSKTFEIASAAYSDAGTYTLYVDKEGCDNTSPDFNISVIAAPGLDFTLDDDEVSNNWDATVIVQSSESGVTYNAYINSVEVSSAIGDGTDLSIPIYADDLAVGDNTIEIRAENENCELVLTNDANVLVRQQGVTISETTGLSTDETGGSDDFTVVLDAEPLVPITISISSSDESEGTVSASNLTFTSANWFTAQTITVTGVDDDIDDDGVDYNIEFAIVANSDPDYSGIVIPDVTATNNDDTDLYGVTVSSVSNNTEEDAADDNNEATFTIKLNSEPTADVIITLRSDNLDEGTIDKNTLTFTSGNWDSEQIVTISGVDDFIDEIDVEYNIEIDDASSSDAKYDGLVISNLTLLNIDNDVAGFNVSPISNDINESISSTATFTIKLTSQPTHDVVIGLTSSDPSEGTVLPTSITIIPGDWNTGATITVTGVVDDVDDGDVSFDIETTLSSSTDANYDDEIVPDVSVTTLDDDVAGFTVSTTSLTTSESLTDDSFTIVLNSQPTGTVKLGFSSNDTGEGTVSPASFEFTSSNWKVPQTITVTGVDDKIVDGPQTFTIQNTVISSGDDKYTSLDPADVTVTNTDYDDVVGITVTPTSGLVTTEAGGTDDFTLVLTSQPVADVSIALSLSDGTEATLSASSITFTSANWNSPQTITVTGKDDDIDDGNVTYSIDTDPSTSADPNYSGVDASNVSATNNDDADAVGFTVTAISNNTKEDGTDATFTIKLNSEPTADVIIGISSTKPTEGTVSTPELTFTASTWATAQIVTVTGVDDNIVDGIQAYVITTATASSTDLTYNGLDPDNVNLNNEDDGDVAGITITPTTGLQTAENGTTASFTVKLTSEPTHAVTISLSSDDTSEGTVSPTSVVINPADWVNTIPITITGVNDASADGDQVYHINTSASSTDGIYDAIDPDDVTATNIDGDLASINVTPISGDTDEDGATATFEVKLTSQPTGDVTIPVSTSDATEGSISITNLVFTSVNWDTAQVVTVTGLEDAIDDGDVSFDIVLAPATSSDGNYDGMDEDDVAVVNNDNGDAAGISVSPLSGLATTEAGGSSSFGVVLESEPTTDVVITLDSNNPLEGTVDKTSLTFTPLNWDDVQMVTVTGVDDEVDDGDIAYKIELNAPTIGDPNYTAINPDDVSVSNIDNDEVGIILSPISGLETTEAGGTVTFTVVLNSEPTADVSFNLVSSNTSEGTIDKATLIWTAANWDSVQTVTITGIDDAYDDGDVAYTITTSTVTSDDAKYAAILVDNVSVTNTDDDTFGITVTPTADLITTEAGGQATFTVVLNSRPTDPVSIGLTSSKTSEGTLSASSLNFDGDNWSTAQDVIITGQPDDIDDGDQSYTITTAAAVSSDTDYSGLNAADVSVTNTDDDDAGITVNTSSTGNTDEGGGTTSFTVVLTSQPTADVVIPMTSTKTDEGTVASSITFTASNWDDPQEVLVTGQSDDVDDGDQDYTIEIYNPTGSDANYTAIDPNDVDLTNIDNNTVGIIVSSISRHTNESAQTATFTVVLNSEPTDDVVIDISSLDPSEGSLSISALTFTSSNWSNVKTVVVTGVNDDIDDGTIEYQIQTNKAVSSDVLYAAINPSDVTVYNDDDSDAAGITVNTTLTGNTTEKGGTTSFSIVLDSEPTHDVSIPVSSSNTDEGTIVETVIEFTTLNWNIAQTIIVTGIDDDIDDGNVSYKILTALAISDDDNYKDLDADDVDLQNEDDDDAGISVSTISQHTTELGGTATFSVVLNSEPLDEVTIQFTNNYTTEVLLDKSNVVFTAANWDVSQTVTLTGQDDAIDDGDQYFDIITSSGISLDSKYDGRNADDVSVVNDDDDEVGVVLTAISGNTTELGAGTATFTVVLNSEPTSDVVITLGSDNETEGLVSPTSLTFTAGTTGNWGSAQTVTVTGQDEDIDDGDILYHVTLSSPVSDDSKYAAIVIDDVDVTNIDNDDAGITLSQTSGLVTTEESTGTASFTIVLDSEPIDDVSISFLSTDETEGTVSDASLIFSSSDWDTEQTITITGVDEDIDDGDIAYSITTGNAVSIGDAVYNGMTVSNVSVSNTDNDAVGFTVVQTGGTSTTSENLSTDEFTVVLDAEPLSDVVITVTSSNTDEGVVDKANLTFTDDNWITEQIVTITGVNDNIEDGSVTYNITIAIDDANSQDQFDPLLDQIITATNTDNDVAGIDVSSIVGNTLEDGTKASFTIRLNTEPTDSVLIGLSSSDISEGVPDVDTVRFAADNYSILQTIYISGITDDLDDGDITYTIITANSESTDPNYSNKVVDDVSVINEDNNVSGVTLTSAADKTTNESGTTDSFYVKLDCEPTHNVVINLSSSNTLEGTVSPATLTFTAGTTGNWGDDQEVTITGVDDLVDDDDQDFTIETSAVSSTDAIYNGMEVDDVAVTNEDNDAAGFTVSTINDISELGTTETFTIKLNTKPIQDVLIHIESGDLTEASVDTNLVFTTDNWLTNQTVKVTGVDDDIADGDIAFSIIIDPATGSDDKYSGLDADDVAITNLDDGTPVAYDDAETTNEDANLYIDVLANDLGLDDGGLSVTIATDPEHGMLTINGDNTITYKPDFNYYGSDSFVYEVCDSDTECSSATVNITVNPVNDYIPLLSDDSRGTSKNTARIIDVLVNDEGLDDGGFVMTEAVAPAHGSIVINADSTITYTPDNDYLGEDTFEYQVCDRDGDCAIAMVTMTVQENNTIPVANDDFATTDVNKNVTVNVLVNDSGLEDGVGIVDIAVKPTEGLVTVNSNKTITYTPNGGFTGSDSLTYSVADIDGDYATAKVYFTVNAASNNIPVANDDARGVDIGLTVNIDVLDNDTGLEDGGISLTIVGLADHGDLVLEANNTISYTPDAFFEGEDTFEYQVCDADSDCDNAIVTITVKEDNANPVAVDDAATTYEETTTTINVLDNDTGLEDGVADVIIYTEPAIGSVVVNANLTVSYTPPAWYLGSDSFEYKVIDTEGDNATATVDVMVIEKPNFVPLANDDSCATIIDVPVIVDVLANDSGLEDGEISISSVTTPTNGTATINGDNTVTCTPSTDFLGKDSFEYTVEDANGDTDVGTVTVNVKLTNDLPIAYNDTVETYVNTSVTLNVLSNDLGLGDGVGIVEIYTQGTVGSATVNPDNTITYTPENWILGADSLKYKVVDVDGDFDTATVILNIIEKPNFIPIANDDSCATAINLPVSINVLQNDTGLEDTAIVVSTLSLPTNGGLVINADNTITYTPALDDIGIYTFEYQVEDADGDLASATVKINVKLTNENPIAFNDTASTYMDTEVTVNVLNNDMGLEDGVGVLTLTNGPQNGTAIVNSDKTISYTPENWYLGTDSVSYNITDVDGDNSTATLIINIEVKPNFVPVANDDSRGTSINTPVIVDVLINDTGLEDGGIVVSELSAPSAGSISVNVADNTITYTPATDDIGIYTFEYQVEDADGDTDNATVAINVKESNAVPLANNDTAYTYINTEVSINILSNDLGLEDGLDTILIHVQPLNGVVLLNDDNTLSYTPNNWYNATDSLKYMIKDIDGDYSIATVIIEVDVKPNFLPLAVNDSRGTTINSAVKIDVLENDTGLEDGGIIISTLTVPANGVAIINADQTVTYTPNDDFLGTDAFNYTIEDVDGDESTASVIVAVKESNALPVAVKDSASTIINTEVIIHVLANDSGLEDGIGSLTIDVDPSRGTAVVNNDNTITYTPFAWNEGPDTFEYKVADVDGDYDKAEVYVSVGTLANSIPIANDDRRGATKNTAAVLNVLVNDTGLEDGGLVLTIPVAPDPGNGSVVVNTDNTLTFTPATDFLGTATFTYRVCDIDDECDEATVSVNVKESNALPVAYNDTVTTYLNTSITVNVADNDLGLDDGFISLSIYEQPKNGSVTVKDDKTIIYTPSAWYLGSDSLQYMIEDVDGDNGIATVYINIEEVSDYLPVANDDSRGTVINTTVKVDVLVNDTGLEDGGIIITSTTEPTNGAVVINADNTISYTPNTAFLGTDTFNYTIEDADGDSDNATVSINVKLTNALPEAVNDTVSTQMSTLLTVNVLANDTGLEDGVKGVSIYTNPPNGTVFVNSDNTINYIPANWYEGSDNFFYMVEDVDGDYGIAEVVVSIADVGNLIPVANDDSRGTAINTAVNVDVLINDTELEDGGIIVTSLTNPSNGTILVNADNTITYTPVDDYLGTDSFEYTVEDAQGDSDQATVTINVKLTNALPVAVNDSTSTPMSTSVTVNVLDNDTGLEDGVQAVSIFANPSNGSVIINADNTFTYTPSNWYLGSDSFFYMVEDVDGDYGLAEVVIEISEAENSVPVANDDSRGTVVNTAVTVDVLVNDTGLEDGGIIITSATEPANGAIVVNADNTITYTPETGWLGTDIFTYTIEDADGDSDNATVSINVKLTNALPEAVNDTVATPMSTLITVNVLANDTGLEDGVDGVSIYTYPSNGAVIVNDDNTISYTPANWYEGTDKFSYMVEDVDGDYGIAEVVVSIADAGNLVPVANDDSRGTVMNSAVNVDVLINDTELEDGGIIVTSLTNPSNGMILVNADNTITYTPAEDYLGTDSFEYTVEDAQGDSDNATVTIYVKLTNALPVAVNDTTTTPMSTAVTVNVLANDTGLEDGVQAVSIFENPSNGSVIINADNTFTYTPSNWYLGSDSFFYMVEDVDGDYALAEVVISIAEAANSIPVANNDSRGTSINTAVTIDVLINDTDLDDGGLVLSIPIDPVTGSAIINADNTITFTPNTNMLGVETFTYQVCDANGDCDDAIVSINVKESNVVPTALNDTVSTELNTEINVNVLNNDTGLDDGVLGVYIFTQAVNGTAVVNDDNTVTYTPYNWYLGVDSVEYLVNDIDGDYSIATVIVNITEKVNHIPVAVDDNRATTENNAIDVNVLFNDTGLEDGGLELSISTTPTLGSTFVNADHTITYTPQTNWLGTETFTYKVCDIDGECDTAVVSIHVKEFNAQPVAVDDTTITFINTTVIANVLNNDSGLEDGILGLSIVSHPVNGTVLVNADNTLSYSPSTWYVGYDTLSYAVIDLDGDLAVAYLFVDIRAGNIAPVASNDSYYLNESDTLTIDAPGILINDFDNEGKELSSILVSDVSYGSLNLNTDGSFIYIHDGTEVAVDTFIYKVNDGRDDGNEAIVAINIIQVNDNPVAIADTLFITEGTTSVESNIIANDMDVNSDTLYLTSIDAFTLKAASIPTLYGLLNWENDGTVTYKLDNSNDLVSDMIEGDSLKLLFDYSISDSNGGFANSTLAIIVIGNNDNLNNNYPEPEEDYFTIGEEDIKISGNVLANDVDADDETLHVSEFESGNTPDSLPTDYGWIVWDSDGNFTYYLDVTNQEVIDLNVDEALNETFSYIASDGLDVASSYLNIDILGVTYLSDVNPTDGFSPNGDGVNDYFVIKNIDVYPDNELIIYNRWGTKVFSSKNYENTWDGKSSSSNKLLPAGVYFYVLTIGDNKKPLNGNVFLKY